MIDALGKMYDKAAPVINQALGWVFDLIPVWVKIVILAPFVLLSIYLLCKISKPIGRGLTALCKAIKNYLDNKGVI